ncbi:LodA/GoxA family CTQ-dependent oxidase [Luteolibacter ambystomatis]|uniref:LodA/GoxA family CTQ-dependent oxidase n=1 Tax=Luteolibacter ambystomatis TaxID=2824561 RepID=A0A975J1X4_9BACT|nr:LodA/GoxA family CTQ-dependent oxidase [Luteolibacter ambystomatis]QUE52491.1 LodA/GoxA family CTQ-dependent oxidase [Luteolibacter ambystomatis]
MSDTTSCQDSVIVRAAIHPAIGVARVGDAETAYYIGPEVTDPLPGANSGHHRTTTGELKRQAALFRIYGYNAAGEVVRELTADDADIQWTAHVANRKADWFRFITAMDIPETHDLTVPRRNAAVKGADREKLVIDPGPRTITGRNVSGGAEHRFDTGTFTGVVVPLGELQTDEQGRLLFLGGHGVSASPSGAPPFNPADPDTFNNADDWYDDMSDGPVDATVSISGRSIPVEGAWVLCAPPNYAPDVIGWRTLYDLLVDTYIDAGTLPLPGTTSFTRDILPLLQRLSNLQWVNKGFAAMYGRGRPMDFEDREFIRTLSLSGQDGEPYEELRRTIFNTFRPFDNEVNEPRLWPWIYGDDFGGELFSPSPNTMLALPQLQQLHLQRWVNGVFDDDWHPAHTPPRTLAEVPLAEQPAMLDKAALHYCLADAFHPGCETTWPMRHSTLYGSPFRIRRRQTAEPAGEYGSTLDQQEALSLTGPLYAQGPGDITRWMGLPWQGDTAYCRSGYDPQYDPFLPTFWAARVPNWVLTQEDYEIVMNESLPRPQRIAAYNRRAYWFRSIDQAPDIPARMEKMVAEFGAQGIVEAQPGIVDDPDFPAIIYVENLSESRKQQFAAATESLQMLRAAAPANSWQEKLHTAGWDSEEHLREAVNLRARRKS